MQLIALIIELHSLLGWPPLCAHGAFHISLALGLVVQVVSIGDIASPGRFIRVILDHVARLSATETKGELSALLLLFCPRALSGRSDLHWLFSLQIQGVREARGSDRRRQLWKQQASAAKKCSKL